MHTHVGELHRRIEQQDARLDRAGKVCLLMAERMNYLEQMLKVQCHQETRDRDTDVRLPSPASTVPTFSPAPESDVIDPFRYIDFEANIEAGMGSSMLSLVPSQEDLSPPYHILLSPSSLSPSSLSPSPVPACHLPFSSV
jgi:hypothetical protein